RNPAARMLLTVSPVPITATASGQHVLPASTYTKCTLRAIAGDIAQDEPDIHYFPGYELISSHPGRGMFFDPNLRTINDAGVAFVLKNLAAAIGYGGAGYRSTEGLLCDEEALEKAAPNGDGA
ncbi:MAG: GSCFA domain-containing protein, partial [Caulobacteraceae bacterium]